MLDNQLREMLWAISSETMLELMAMATSPHEKDFFEELQQIAETKEFENLKETIKKAKKGEFLTSGN